MPKIQPIGKTDSLAGKIKTLRSETIYSMLLGDFKGFRKAQKEYAKVAVDNFELTKSVPSPQINNVPLFSKIGLNILKCIFLNKFTKKTPEEKLLKQMAKQDKKEELAKSYIKD